MTSWFKFFKFFKFLICINSEKEDNLACVAGGISRASAFVLVAKPASPLVNSSRTSLAME